jgi:C_GCAxxG_C_C family probable redox protein
MMADAPHRTRTIDISSLSKIAVEKSRQGFSCSEAILVAFGTLFDLPDDLAIKIASGFRGGIGLLGETCGVVTGGALVLGLAFGTPDLKDTFSREHTYLQVGEFGERFKSRLGSLSCRELCGMRENYTAEEAKAVRDSGRHYQIVKTGAEILEAILKNEHDFL